MAFQELCLVRVLDQSPKLLYHYPPAASIPPTAVTTLLLSLGRGKIVHRTIEGCEWLLTQVEQDIYLSVMTSNKSATRECECLIAQLAQRLSSPIP